MIERSPRIYISVIGGANATKADLNLAEEVGKLLAKRGAIIVCGGLGGVMTAVARGAKQFDGLVIGILPGDQKNAANEFIDIPIPTGLGIARNLLVVRAGDAVIAIDGEWGTLSEIALAKNCGKTVVGLRTFEIDGIIMAKDPSEAVGLAMQAALEAYENERD